MRLVAWLHVGLFRFCIWLLRQAGRTLWFTVGAILALLHEEIQRYLGLLLWGVVILLAGKATLNYAPANMKLPLVLVILGLTVIWGLALLRSVRFTMHTNLRAVRQRRYFRELRGEVGQLGGRLEALRGGLGRRAWGTPLGGMWKGNRERRDREAAEAEAAAAQAERDRAVEAAWEEAVAAKRAEREEFAAAASARRRDAP